MTIHIGYIHFVDTEQADGTRQGRSSALVVKPATKGYELYCGALGKNNPTTNYRSTEAAIQAGKELLRRHKGTALKRPKEIRLT